MILQSVQLDLLEPAETRLFRAWSTFHSENPSVYRTFIRFTFEAMDARRHYSAKAIFERMRWHLDIETESADDFKLNNNYPAFYARLFMRDHPKLPGFFHTREQRGDKP